VLSVSLQFFDSLALALGPSVGLGNCGTDLISWLSLGRYASWIRSR